MSRPPKENLRIINGKFYVTTVVAAQLCGVSMQSLNSWRKRANPPPYDDQYELYPVDSLGEWVRTEQIYRKGVGGKYPWKPDMSRYGGKHVVTSTPVTMMPGMEPPVPEDQEERLKRLRADKLEMEIMQKAGMLILADEVTLAMSSMVTNVKSRLLGLPAETAETLALKTDAIEVQEYLDEEITIALEELTPDWTKEIDFEASDEDDEDE